LREFYGTLTGSQAPQNHQLRAEDFVKLLNRPGIR
jgi:hypothetical protein